MTPSIRPVRSLVPYSLKRVHSEPGAVAEYVLQNILILVWDVQPTAPIIARLEAANAHVRQGAARGMSMIHVVKAPLELPDDATRNAMVNMLKAYNVRQVAMIVNASGFLMSMVRSVVTGLRVVTGGHFDYRIVSEIKDVLDWFPAAHELKTGVAVDEAHLERALREASENALAS